ncbi:CinA family protein [Blastococcus sp. Marseille-P5729]|uniref:CinA family protein n=1 Tax=Blastococcus sp. Marseille-P5729 TaxID=2086582 RepID=UPI000D100259|nr:CinA family protein [Blastococcus sp. Marseille-P5729]
MDGLMTIAKSVAERLRERRETVAVAESSSGGLIAAALLAQPGASAYFLGGAVVYTKVAGAELLGFTSSDLTGVRSSSEPYAFILADRMRERLGATWGLSETGAAGPGGNRYGDASGHTCVSLVGPAELSRTIETGSDDREANMRAFALAALTLLDEALS